MRTGNVHITICVGRKQKQFNFPFGGKTDILSNGLLPGNGKECAINPQSEPQRSLAVRKRLAGTMEHTVGRRVSSEQTVPHWRAAKDSRGASKKGRRMGSSFPPYAHAATRDAAHSGECLPHSGDPA